MVVLIFNKNMYVYIKVKDKAVSFIIGGFKGGVGLVGGGGYEIPFLTSLLALSY